MEVRPSSVALRLVLKRHPLDTTDPSLHERARSLVIKREPDLEGKPIFSFGRKAFEAYSAQPTQPFLMLMYAAEAAKEIGQRRVLSMLNDAIQETTGPLGHRKEERAYLKDQIRRRQPDADPQLVAAQEKSIDDLFTLGRNMIFYRAAALAEDILAYTGRGIVGLLNSVNVSIEEDAHRIKTIFNAFVKRDQPHGESSENAELTTATQKGIRILTGKDASQPGALKPGVIVHIPGTRDGLVVQDVIPANGIPKSRIGKAWNNFWRFWHSMHGFASEYGTRSGFMRGPIAGDTLHFTDEQTSLRNSAPVRIPAAS